MSQKIIIPLLAAAAFGAGYSSRWWSEQGRTLVAPPSDLVPVPAVSGTGAKEGSKSSAGSNAEKRAKLIAEIEKARAQIEAYSKRNQEIDAEFDRDFAAILNPEQKEKYLAGQKNNAEWRAKQQARAAAETGPLTDEQISDLQRAPLWNAMFKIACTWGLERYTKEYKLDGKQQQQVHALLQVRRDKYIALVDASTPPSIRYSQLATQAKKLGAEPKKPETEAKPKQ